MDVSGGRVKAARVRQMSRPGAKCQGEEVASVKRLPSAPSFKAGGQVLRRRRRNHQGEEEETAKEKKEIIFVKDRTIPVETESSSRPG